MRLFIVSVSVLLILNFTSITSDVVDSFSTCNEFFLDNKPPMIPGILENSVSMDQNRYKIICQKYKNEYRFATLYDTNKKIPVFSAYKYTKQQQFSRPHLRWRIEPDLKGNQAKKEDYKGCEEQNLSRGHLFPSSHAPDLITAKSTFTLTNAVPQEKSFNGGSWNHMEEKTREIMKNRCCNKENQNEVLAYVLTGAVPGNTQMKRVNIPSYMWMAFCCYDSIDRTWVSQAYWAQNIDEGKGKEIKEQSLQDLQQFLKNSLKVKGSGEVQLFGQRCKNKKRL